eukprot:5005339-Prymnesium_polylepis.1
MARSQLEGMLPTLSATARKVYSLRHKIPPHSEARRCQPGMAVTPPLPPCRMAQGRSVNKKNFFFKRFLQPRAMAF